ncbi:MAG: hypothetical protein ACKO85_16310 [Isosphaeraceae bacterium]
MIDYYFKAASSATTSLFLAGADVFCFQPVFAWFDEQQLQFA